MPLRRPKRKLIWDYIITISLAIFLALFIRTFFFEVYRISNSKMKPTLIPGDTVFVSKSWYGWDIPEIKLIEKLFTHSPQRNDVVLYEDPLNDGLESIKRVVGLPKETIQLTQEKLLINGKPLNGNFLNHSPPRISSPSKAIPANKETGNFGPEKIPEDSIFVIGDLRSSPLPNEKPNWAIIPISALKGKAVWIWLSIPENKKFPQIMWDRLFKKIE